MLAFAGVCALGSSMYSNKRRRSNDKTLEDDFDPMRPLNANPAKKLGKKKPIEHGLTTYMPLPDSEQSIKEAIESVVHQAGLSASAPTNILSAAEDQVQQVLAGQAAKVVQLLRKGEWKSEGSYQVNLFVLCYELWDDGAGDMVGRASSLARALHDQDLVLFEEGGSESMSCVSLSERGRKLADRIMSPV